MSTENEPTEEQIDDMPDLIPTLIPLISETKFVKKTSTQVKTDLFNMINSNIDLDSILKNNYPNELKTLISDFSLFPATRKMILYNYLKSVVNTVEHIPDYRVDNNIEVIQNASINFNKMHYTSVYKDFCKRLMAKILTDSNKAKSAGKAKRPQEDFGTHLKYVNKLKSLLHPITDTKSLITDIIDHSLIRRLYTPMSENIVKNYESMESLGDKVLDIRLYNLFVSFDINVTSATLHLIKNNRLAKSQLSAAYTTLGLDKVFEATYSNSTIDTEHKISRKEDLLEAFFGYIYLELTKRLNGDIVETIIDKLMMKFLSYDLYDNMSFYDQNIKILVEQKLLSDTKVSFDNRGNVSVDKNGLNKFLSYHGISSESSKSGNVHVLSIDKDDGDFLEIKGESKKKAVSDYGYILVLNKLMSLYKFNVPMIYNFYASRFMDRNIWKALNETFESDIIMIDTNTLKYEVVVTMLNDISLRAIEPKYKTVVGLEEARSIIEHHEPSKGPLKNKIMQAKKMLTKHIGYMELGKIIVWSIVIANITEVLKHYKSSGNEDEDVIDEGIAGFNIALGDEDEEYASDGEGFDFEDDLDL